MSAMSQLELTVLCFSIFMLLPTMLCLCIGMVSWQDVDKAEEEIDLIDQQIDHM